MTHPYYCDVDKSPPSKENLCACMDVHLVNSLFIICSLWKYKDLIVNFFLDFSCLFEGPLYHKRLPFLALLMFPSVLFRV